jgi:hypothetical protein
MQNSNYLSREKASAYLLSTWGIKRAVGTLAKLAVIGGGPAFHKAGRNPLYAPSDLDAWAARVIGPRKFSTSDQPQRAA